MRFIIQSHDLLHGNGWLYKLFFKDELVYVGITTNHHPLMRIAAHFKNKQFDSYEVEQHCLSDLPKIELFEIKKHKPRFNVMGISGKGHLQWIAPNIPGATQKEFTRLDAVLYVRSMLKRNGVSLSNKQTQYLNNNFHKIVWKEGRKYVQSNLNEFVIEVLSDQNLHFRIPKQ